MLVYKRKKYLMREHTALFLSVIITFSLLSCSSLARKKERTNTTPKSFFSIKPKQEFNKYRAIIDQKLSYFCYQSESLKRFKGEDNCIKFINTTYKTCMDKNNWIESDQLIKCIDRHLNI